MSTYRSVGDGLSKKVNGLFGGLDSLRGEKKELRLYVLTSATGELNGITG